MEGLALGRRTGQLRSSGAGTIGAGGFFWANTMAFFCGKTHVFLWANTMGVDIFLMGGNGKGDDFWMNLDFGVDEFSTNS